MRNLKLFAAILFAAMFFINASANVTPKDYTWTTQSKNSSESMPCGGGDIGLNVLVENGELMFYICRSGAYDEHGTLLKQGRVRMKFKDAAGVPITAEPFRQTLKLNEGYTDIQLGDVNVKLWVDVFRPVIHVETIGKKSIICEVSYENWRYTDRKMRSNESHQSSLKWSDISNVYTTKDIITAKGNSVTFYHKNPAITVFEHTVKVASMTSVIDRMWNPLAHLVSGGRMWGDNLVFDSELSQNYIDTDYRSWLFRSVKPAKKHTLNIALHIGQAKDVAQWEKDLDKTIASINIKRDEKATRKWWNEFWQRSYIEADGEASEMTRNYTLFRYMLGCNAFGQNPTKFNGGLFTFDPSFVRSSNPFTPDYRNWSGSTMTAQNQRLIYWPMLKSGDFEMMLPQFDFYLNMLGNAELRTETVWGHKGACFSEHMEVFGLPNFAEFGETRPEWYDKGVDYNDWLEYEWDTVLEFCMMMLESRRYAGTDIKRYMPLIESSLRFFDEHYQYLASRRGKHTLDENGKLILYPGSACETYKMTKDAVSTIAALQNVTKSLIDVKREQSDADTTAWQQMLSRIPEIPFRMLEGKKVIAPARTWERINNQESPQLYPVFPWRMYGVIMSNEEDLQIARNTYLYDPHVIKYRSHMGWKQDMIWAACLGMTEEATELAKKKLASSKHRFPAFWGPGFDWTPDHNHGGSAMIGLQEMLMQTDGDKIVLFPAWKKNWDIRFKLHAPKNTVVEAELKDGKVVNLKVTPESRLKDVVTF